MKKIFGFSNYAADSEGRIHNIKRGTVLSPSTPSRYLKVRIKGDDGIRRTISVHRLVCIAFHGLPPEGYQVDHIDFNKHNNRPDNLEWVTPQENRRRQREANYLSGVKYYFDEPTSLRVQELYSVYPLWYIAEKLGVCSTVIKNHLIDIGIYDGRRNRMKLSSPKKISEYDVAEIRRLYLTGLYTNSVLANKYGVTEQAIGRYTKDINRIEVRNNNIAKVYKDGNSLLDVSSLFGVSVSFVKKLCSSRGILRNEDVHDVYATAIIQECDLDKLNEYIDKGFSIKKIALKFDCGIGAVESALKRFGLKTKATSGKKREYDYKELYEMNLTMPQWKIAEKLGISQPNVASIVSKYKKENGIIGHGNVIRHAQNRG